MFHNSKPVDYSDKISYDSWYIDSGVIVHFSKYKHSLKDYEDRTLSSISITNGSNFKAIGLGTTEIPLKSIIVLDIKNVVHVSEMI